MTSEDEQVIDVGPSGDVDMEDDPSVKRRGRGFDPRTDGPASDGVKHTGKFDVLPDNGDAIPDGQKEDDAISAARSVEGYIIIVTGIDEEATEEEVMEKFADYGRVCDCHLNLDRRTGYVKGYALLEYEKLQEAVAAIEACQDGLTLMDKDLRAGFAFVHPPASGMRIAGSSHSRSRGGAARDRSRSPSRR